MDQSVLSKLNSPQQKWAQDQLSQGVDAKAVQQGLDKANKPGFLESLLPTIGGIGGGLLGSLIEPGFGSIAGASGGSALGQQLENMLTGTKSSTFGAGVEGGVGQAAGLGLGKVLGAGGETLGKIGENALNAKSVASYAKPFSGIAKTSAAKNSNLAGTTDLAKNLGIENSPEALQKAASVATGSNGHMTNILNDIADNAGQLPADGLPARISTALEDAGTDTNIAPVKWLNKRIETMVTPVTKTAGGTTVGPLMAGDAAGATIGEGVGGGDLLSTIKKLDSQIRIYDKPGVTLNVQDAANKTGLQNVKNELEDALYNNIDKHVASYKVSPELEQQILKDAGGNQAHASEIINRINGANTGQKLRSAQKDFVDMSNIGKEQAYYNKGVIPGQAEVDAASAPLAAGADIVGGAKHGIPGAVVGALKGMGDVLVPHAAKLGSGAAKALTAGAVSPVDILTQLGAHAPGLAESAPGFNGGGGMNAQPEAQPQPMNNILSDPALRYALVTHPEAVMPLIEKAQAAQAGQSSLGGLESSYGAAGGGGGMGSGVLAEISKFIPGTPAFQYEQQKNALASQIAKATGADPHAIAAMLPSLMADQGGAQNAFGALQGQLGAYSAPQGGIGASVLGSM